MTTLQGPTITWIYAGLTGKTALYFVITHLDRFSLTVHIE